jgi:hypothetical protein
MKDAGMRIRVEPELRAEFVAVCQSQDIPAAQVIRQFMRGYVQQVRSSANTSEGKKAKKMIGAKDA